MGLYPILRIHYLAYDSTTVRRGVKRLIHNAPSFGCNVIVPNYVIILLKF